MELRAAEGPFQGWYLGRVDGVLELVKNPEKAVKVRMLETTQEIGDRK